MRVRLSNPTFHPDLVRYLRARDYLAVEERGAVTVVPINAVSERGDRARLERDLESWLALRDDVTVVVEDEG